MIVSFKFLGKVLGDSVKITKNRNPSVQTIDRSLEIAGNCLAILIGVFGILNGIANFSKNNNTFKK